MKRFLILSIVMMLGIMLFAQTQQGYVKTKGRMVNGKLVPGQGLKGATVSVHGRTAVLVNKDNGAFSFPVPEAQFRIDSVRKKGYQLVDMDALSKTYKHSTNPIYLVMETPEQLLQDQLDNYSRINAAQTKLITQLKNEVDALKEQNKLTEEEYYQQLSEIAEMQMENQELVSDMAERYSRIDFDQLDEFNRHISQLIINGELYKADSIIRAKGNMDDRRTEYFRMRDVNNKESLDLETRQEKLERSKALEKKTLDELGQDCYYKYETCKLRHQADSTKYWIEYRFDLDTLNEDWLGDVIEYMFYSLDDQGAIDYLQRALRLALMNHGEISKEVADIYNDLGVAYGKYDITKGIQSLQHAKKIDSLLNIQDESIYHNIGKYYQMQADFSKANHYFQIALDIAKNKYGENSNSVATINAGIGDLYSDQALFNESLEYYTYALDYYLKYFGYYHPNTAIVYNDMGLVYASQKDFQKALECYNHAFVIIKELFGENHPEIATFQNNIGTIYYKEKNYQKALEYYNLALSAQESTYGPESLLVSYPLNNIGNTLLLEGEFDKALDVLNRALKIRIKNLGLEHPIVATTTHNIAAVYEMKGDYVKALELYEEALSIRIKALGADHPSSINTQNRISEIQAKLKEQENK